jgi:hypothetical protein
MTGDTLLTCQQCDRTFARPAERGPVPKFCSASCRQKHHRLTHWEDRPTSGYDREALIDVLVYHWPTNTSGCHCGWSSLGRSFPEHVADVYEAMVARA